MIVIPPSTISLESTNVAASSYSEWSNVTAYSATNNVVVTLESDGVTPRAPHREYEALTSTTGDYPPDSPTKWLDLGATNQYRMLDESVSSQTEAATITVTLGAPHVDRLALFNIEAASVAISVTGGGGTRLTETVFLHTNASTCWSEYFFQDPTYLAELVREIPGWYTDTEVTLTFTAVVGASTAKVGLVVLGKALTVGDLRVGWRAGIEDFSKRDTDDFGRTILTVRSYAKRLSGEIQLDRDQLGLLTRLLTSVRATACAWDGNSDCTDDEPLIIYGFVSDWQVLVSYPRISFCTFEITGLT